MPDICSSRDLHAYPSAYAGFLGDALPRLPVRPLDVCLSFLTAFTRHKLRAERVPVY